MPYLNISDVQQHTLEVWRVFVRHLETNKTAIFPKHIAELLPSFLEWRNDTTGMQMVRDYFLEDSADGAVRYEAFVKTVADSVALKLFPKLENSALAAAAKIPSHYDTHAQIRHLHEHQLMLEIEMADSETNTYRDLERQIRELEDKHARLMAEASKQRNAAVEKEAVHAYMVQTLDNVLAEARTHAHALVAVFENTGETIGIEQDGARDVGKTSHPHGVSRKMR